VDGYGLTIVDLNNVDYKDDPWVVASQVAQVLYIADPAKKIKHVVVPGKQDIIGVDGIDDVEEYNQYDEMNLFTDVPQKMRILEASIRKDDKPWACKDGESRTLVFQHFYLLHTLQLDFDIFLMFHISKYAYGKNLIFFRGVLLFFEINGFSA
jgi:hypothetical protein